MPYVEKEYRLYYAAKNYVKSLIDVQYNVYKPDGVKLGPYFMAELDSVEAAGIYFSAFNEADMEGNYIFIVDCPSNPKQNEKSVFFEKQIWTELNRDQLLLDLSFMKDVEGGAWELVPPNDLTFYKSDNVTIVAQFKCYNEAGLPAIEGVVRCERV